MNKKITIQDIARIAGVSKSTVSRSLNDNPMIAESTRKKIKKIAEDLRFTYNTNARSLTLKKVDSVAIITTSDKSATDYMNLLIDSAREYFENFGIDVLIAHPENSATGESNIRRLVMTAKVSGLFIICPHIKNEDWDFLKETAFPCVVTHFRPGNTYYNHFNCFFVDNEKGGYMATELLIKNSRKNILTISEGKGQIQFLDRTAGYMKALEDHKLPVHEEYIIEGECSYEFAYQSIIDRKALLRKIDGIFVQADVMAAGVINALQDMGISIPDDIAIVGFDDVAYSSYLRPALTTTRQPRERLIESASRNLFDQIEGTKKAAMEMRLFNPELILRSSCHAADEG